MEKLKQGSVYGSEKKRGIRMSFQDEMKQIFLRVAAGEVEPKEWEAWWNNRSNALSVWVTARRKTSVPPCTTEHYQSSICRQPDALNNDNRKFPFLHKARICFS